MSNLIRIHDEDDFMVDYDNKNGRYRVSYFEDNHFKDECWFPKQVEPVEDFLVKNVVESITLEQDDGTFITFLINKEDEERLERLCKGLGKSENDVLSAALWLLEQSVLTGYKE